MASNRNLFESLFKFHPRQNHTPKENFLTEAFAYFLRNDETVLNSWLSVLLDKAVERATCRIETRQHERDMETETSSYPDMVIDGHADGEPVAIYCEHKWDSPCNTQQLETYRKIVEKRGKHARLVFVGATRKQKAMALGTFPDKACLCFMWEEVYCALDRISEKTTTLKEFLEFMKSHGFSPGQPLSVEEMTAFLKSTGFLGSLLNLAHKLNDGYTWEAIPERFMARRYVHDEWGRVGIRFETEEWKPAMTVGFLYDVKDHAVTLVNPNKGIDLMLRLEAEPKNTRNIQPALDVLREKRKELSNSSARVLLLDEPGNGNRHSVLIAQECLADVIVNATTVAEQLTAIYGRVNTWLEILYKDGKLEEGLKRSGLDSGMTQVG